MNIVVNIVLDWLKLNDIYNVRGVTTLVLIYYNGFKNILLIHQLSCWNKFLICIMLHIVLMWSQSNHFFAPCIHGYMQVVVVWSHAFLMICMAFALVLHVQAWSVVQCMVICIASIHTIYIYNRRSPQPNHYRMFK
jgi:hypothetical protein